MNIESDNNEIMCKCCSNWYKSSNFYKTAKGKITFICLMCNDKRIKQRKLEYLNYQKYMRQINKTKKDNENIFKID